MATDAQTSIVEHFRTLRWAGTAARQFGIAADEQTVIEVIGSPIRQITMLGTMPPKDTAIVRRNAAYAATLLTLVAPHWRGAHDWLAAQLRRRAREAMISQNGWTITIGYEPRMALLTWKAVR